MGSFFRNVSFTTLLTAFFIPVLSGAADSTLDFSAGCKLYRLENKAWAPTDAASKEGAVIPSASVVKDAAFFVFRDASGIYGVSKKCVKASAAGHAPRPAVVSKTKPARRRRSAAKPRAAIERKSLWSVAFAFGMNLSPSATIDTNSSIDGASSASQKYKSSLGFLGEASYRSSSLLRYNLETGLSQLSDTEGNGNEVSHIAIRPDFVFSAGEASEVYVGPLLGLFFFSQNAETVGASTIKQQTPSALLLGARLGYDLALSEQFDLGAFLEYFKPGSFKVHSDITSPVAATVDYTVKVSWIFLGARFVIHF